MLTSRTTLTQFLIEERRHHPEASGDFNALILDVALACKVIAHQVALGPLAGNHGAAGATNVQGEDQQKLDVLANNAFLRATEWGGHTAGMVSEEIDEPYLLPREFPRGRYLLMFDPLDGSSNIDVNVSIGTIFSIFDAKPGEPDASFLRPADEQLAGGYIIYGPLIAGCTTIVFEGKPVGTPDAGTFWRVIQNHKVKSFFTAPTALRAIKREDPNGELIKDYNLRNLQALFLAGERADPDTIKWAQRHLRVPVIDHWWQTETGWAIAGNPLGIEELPVKIGSPSVPMPGYDVKVLDEGGHPVKSGDLGAIAVKLPLPPGTLPGLWNAEDRFRKSYLNHFPGYYETGDAGYIDEDGYLYIMARTDDVINVAGHRLSTGAMEEVLAGHDDVAECAVIGVADQLKGQMPLGFLCLNKGTNRPSEEIVKECVKLVRDQIGPVAAFKLACVVDRLPKTRSGKILRATMVKIADGETYKMPATIDDPAILDEIADALKGLGYPSQ